VKIAFACGHGQLVYLGDRLREGPGAARPYSEIVAPRASRSLCLPRSRLGDEVYRSIRRLSAASGAREQASNVRGSLERTGLMIDD